MTKARGGKKDKDLLDPNPEPEREPNSEVKDSELKETDTMIIGTGKALPMKVSEDVNDEDDVSEDDGFKPTYDNEVKFVDADNMECDETIFKAAEDALKEEVVARSGTDRMKLIEVSLHARILQLATLAPIIPGCVDWVTENEKKGKIRCAKEIETFKAFYVQAQDQILNSDETNLWRKAASTLMECAIQCADVMLTMPVQVANGGMHDVMPDLIGVYEATTAPEIDILAAWREESETKKDAYTPMLLIGDLQQLGPLSIASASESEWRPWRQRSTFERFSTFIRHHEVNDMMRMSNGLEMLCSDLYYQGALKPGPGTSLNHEFRQVSVALKKFLNEKYAGVRHEPDSSVYPVLLNVRGDCRAKEHGKSRFNLANIAITLSLTQEPVDNGLVEASQISIVTPYNAQVGLYNEYKLRNGFPQELSVRTTEFFEGREREVMICDLVRAQNDKGRIGFLSSRRRLNVMLSRQRMHLIIVMDTWCIKLGQEDIDGNTNWHASFEKSKKDKTLAHPKEDPEQRRRRQVIQNCYPLQDIIGWLSKRGCVVNILKDDMPGEKYFGKGWDEVNEINMILDVTPETQESATEQEPEPEVEQEPKPEHDSTLEEATGRWGPLDTGSWGTVEPMQGNIQLVQGNFWEGQPDNQDREKKDPPEAW